MKKRILSIITSLALVLPMMCALNIVKPQTADAIDDNPEYEVKILDENGNPSGSGGGMYHQGDAVTVISPSKEGDYVFKNWSAVGIDLTDKQKNLRSFEFTMPANNVTLTIHFAEAVTAVELNIDPPVRGQNIDKYAGYKLLSGEKVVKEEFDSIAISWNPSHAKAKTYTKYTATVIIKPDQNIIFGDNVSVSVAGASNTDCTKNDDGSVTLQCTFPYKERAILKSILNPNEVYKPYGADIDAYLPNFVKIETDDENINYASVLWGTEMYEEPEFRDSYDDTKFSKPVEINGEMILPENIVIGTDEAGEEISTTVSIIVNVSNPYRSELPAVNLNPGIYTENKEVSLSVSDKSTIYYTINGGEETEYTVPIQITGTPEEDVTTTICAYTKNESNPYMSSEKAEYIYTISIPAEKKTVNVINGTGSGEYVAGEQINIVAQPGNGKVFNEWIAETVTYATGISRVLDKTCFEDSTSLVTTLTIPSDLADGEFLKVTAKCLDAVTAVKLNADIPSYGGTMPTEMTTSTEGVSLNGFLVTPNDQTAKENTQYTMTVTVSANEGYVFGETPTFSVNGISASGTPIIENEVITGYKVSYTFETGAREVFQSADATSTQKKYRDVNKGDFADSYYADIDARIYSIPKLKWTVTNTSDEAADVLFDAPSVSGETTVRFGFIITGTESELDSVKKVELNAL